MNYLVTREYLTGGGVRTGEYFIVTNVESTEEAIIAVLEDINTLLHGDTTNIEAKELVKKVERIA